MLPDLLMVVFYGYQKILGVSEQTIWNEKYFLTEWQHSFDLFNSIPILTLLAIVSWKTRKQVWFMVFTSMVIHCLLDLPVHHDDGHRHFFPLSDFRFQSPISYWDPNPYGGIVSILEILLVLIGVAYLWRAESGFQQNLRQKTQQSIQNRLISPSRLQIVLLIVLVIYSLFFLFVVRVWIGAN